MLTRFQLERVSRLLHQGGLIAYPTEAVYGLGCDPANALAVVRLLALKQRSMDKGLILIASNSDQLRPFVDNDILSRREVVSSWPGPVTWLIPALPGAPEWIRGQFSTIAVRVTAHPVVKQLCDSFGGALVSTSANISGQPALRHYLQVWHRFGTNKSVDYIVSGKTGGANQPSRIIDALSGDILR